MLTTPIELIVRNTQHALPKGNVLIFVTRCVQKFLSLEVSFISLETESIKGDFYLKHRAVNSF